MALQSLNQLKYFPSWPPGIYSINSTLASTTLNHANDRAAWIFRMPVAGDIAKIHFRTGFVSGAQTLQVSLQDLASGVPDLTADQYRDVTILDTDDNTVFATGLITSDGTDGGVKRTVAVGDIIAVVFRLPSYSSGSCAIEQMITVSGDGRLPALLFSNTGGVFSIQNADPVIAIEMADGSFPYIHRSAPLSAIATSSVANSSTPDEYALKLKVPAPMRALGVFIKGASTDVEALLYSNAGATLGGPSSCWQVSTSQSSLKDYYFSTPVELEADTFYRIAWRPSTASTRFLNTHTFQSAAQATVYPLGPNIMLSTRTDAGVWTDDTTKYIIAGFIVDQIEDGGGGGGTCTLDNGTAVIPPTCL